MPEPPPAPAGLQGSLAQGLRELSRAQWDTAITKGGSFLKIAAAFTPGLALPAANALQDALEQAGQTALGRGQIAADAEGVLALTGGLTADSAAALRESILSRAFGSDKTTAQFAALFGPWLANAPLPEALARRFIADFLKKAAGRPDPAELRWAAEFAENNAELLRATAQHLREDAANRLRRAAESSGDLKPFVDRILAAIGA